MIWLLSFGSAILAVLPWIFARSRNTGMYMFMPSFVLAMFLYFFTTPSLAGPFLGGFGIITLVLLVLNAVLAFFQEEFKVVIPAILAMVIFSFTSIGSSEMFRAGEYASLVGQVEVRDWKEDIQPKDPRHFRTSSPENATFMAGRAIGQATAVTAGGQQQTSMSQFQLDEKISSVQIIKGELWTIVPIDWKEFRTWSSATPGIPGYMKVHGEDPLVPAQYVALPKGRELRYTPGAFWHQDLGRLVWNTHPTKVIADVHLEVDDGEDGGKPHFIISLATPTIGWWGLKVVGSVVVDPVDGSGVDKFYPLGEEPKWVDRVVAPDIVHNNIDYHGKYASGWWNRNWARVDINVATETHFGYGSNDEPVLATGIASRRTGEGDKKHDSLLGVYYTNTRTGKTVEYRVPGGATEDTCVSQVGVIGEVRLRGLHGTTPQLYNVYGHLAYVVPTQNATHAFEGVAICDVMNPQVHSWGKTAHEAALQFKQVLTGAGSQIAIDGTSTHAKVSGMVARVGSQLLGNDTIYYLLLHNVPHLFTGPSKVDATLPVTQAGDMVNIEYVNSGESILAMYSFKNESVKLSNSELARGVQERATKRIDAVRNPDDEARAKSVLDKLSPAERALLEKQMKK